MHKSYLFVLYILFLEQKSRKMSFRSFWQRFSFSYYSEAVIQPFYISVPIVSSLLFPLLSFRFYFIVTFLSYIFFSLPLVGQTVDPFLSLFCPQHLLVSICLSIKLATSLKFWEGKVCLISRHIQLKSTWWLLQFSTLCFGLDLDHGLYKISSLKALWNCGKIACKTKVFLHSFAVSFFRFLSLWV